jgi:hypothetical protein
MSLDRDEMWMNFAAHPCTGQLLNSLAKQKAQALLNLRGAASVSLDPEVRGFAEALRRIEQFETMIEGKLR